MCDTGTAGVIKVFSVNGVKAVLERLAEQFQVKTGTQVNFTFGTIGVLERRMADGELPDVLVAMSAAITKAEEQGLVARGSGVEVGRTGLGVVVKQGAHAPNISSADNFRTALLSCNSFAYTDPKTGAASGVAFAQILDKLGIGDRVAGKALLIGGGSVGEAVAEGKAELGIQQVTELLPVKGITLLPAFPAALQRITVYHAAPVRGAAPAERAAEFVSFVSGPEARSAFDAAGFGRY